MKIAISDAGREWRGTESVTFALAPGLRRRGHDVVVFCVDGSPLHHRLVEGGVPCRPILGGSDLSPRVLARCWAALRREQPDLVITQKDKDLRWTGLAARLDGIPVLVRHVTDRPLKRKLRYRFFFGWVATHHVANSTATRETLLASAPWLAAKPIAIIRNGIDIARYSEARPAQLGLPPTAVVLGFAGCLETRKGFADFAEAWHQISRALPEAHAVIAGDGPRAREFHDAMRGVPRVHFLGFRKDLEQVFKAIDIFAMPSHFEGFGLVLAEAMASGLACVAYNSSNLPELITHEHDGILVPPRDVDALSRAVIRLAGCPKLRFKLGANAQVTARTHFSAERMIGEYEALATDIAGLV